MAHLHPAPSISQKQRTESPKARGASVLTMPARGARKTRNRPTGIVPARIARVEKWIELCCALDDCEILERRCGAAIAYNVATRKKLDAAYERHEVSDALFLRQNRTLNAAEIRLGEQLMRHARHLRTCSIPECKNLAAQADRQAA